MKSLPLPLRWMLALVLILNGAVAPPVMAHAGMADGQARTVHAMSAHCHHHDALSLSQTAKQGQKKCPCCTDGGACHCSCVVTFALPMIFPDLRPLAPQALANRLHVQETVAAPRHRLLRPPIV